MGVHDWGRFPKSISRTHYLNSPRVENSNGRGGFRHKSRALRFLTNFKANSEHCFSTADDDEKLEIWCREGTLGSKKEVNRMAAKREYRSGRYHARRSNAPPSTYR